MATELIVAVDVPNLEQASRVLDQLADSVRWFKVGLQLFTASGPGVVREIRARGGKVFLDLKFHDIPNTVAGAAQSAAALGAEMFNVHAGGGEAMMRAAMEGGTQAPAARPLVIAVTILTSQPATEADVLKLARSAKTSGLDGVVCSAREAVTLKRELGSDFKLVCPGIRPAWSEKGDQSRVVTPRDAVKAGADYIVVGRPILAAPNPAEAAKRVIEEMHGAY
ncbi:MAG: orotidine 5'-phosphate decarboxylase [Verrucomicrobia bacterium GWF2_62_7]|nr:MAG: orotidine 5'-phosphate decarboxylase [Verrucomicrobia bacterium GWF2_62_7]